MSSFKITRDTALDLLQCELSVLLAIWLAHLCGAHNVGWAAFSAYMVMRSRFAVSATRGMLRIVGTLAGAGLALLYGLWLPFSPALLSAMLFLAGGLTLYCALLSRHGYAWLFTGLTFAMVLIDGMQHADQAMVLFARSRVVEVVVGTAAAVLVSGLAALVWRGKPGVKPDTAAPVPTPAPGWWQPAGLFHAAQAAVALALLPLIWQRFGVASLNQSAITIMAVMMAPLASLTAKRDLQHSKSLHRFVGCVLGGLLASAVLLLGHGAFWSMAVGVCMGVAIGRCVEDQGAGWAYVGTQFSLALLVVLVPDSYGTVDIGPGLERLCGILFGLVCLLPVRLLFWLGRGAR